MNTLRGGSDLGLAAPPWIVGHRGVAGEAPENTLDSLRLAVEQSADMVELDLQLTADDHLVACHDWSLERMGGVERIVEESDLEALREVDVSGPFRSSGRRRSLATLAEVLAALAGVPLNIELKRRVAGRRRVAGALARAIAGRDRLLISSFDWPLLEAVRRLLPAVAIAPLGGRDVDPAELVAGARALGAWGVHCRHSVASRELVDAAKERPVLVYTVDDPETAKALFALGVAGVFTDHAGRLRRQLADAA